MAQHETWLKCDLKKLVTVQALHGAVFSADNAGNKIGVEVLDNGQPAALTGNIMGYAIRSDGQTLIITGVMDGNRPYIILPASAYAVIGPLDVVVKNVVSGKSTTTLAACRLYVQRSSTDTIIDPGHTIPSLEELLAQIDASEAAAKSANDAAGAANAAAASANSAAGKLENMTATASAVAPGTANIKPTVTTTGGHYNIAFKVPRGEKGDPGADASVTGTAVSYQNSAVGTSVPTGAWLDSQPATPQGQFLWVRTVLTWNDRQATTLYSVSRQRMDGSGSVSTVGGIRRDGSGDIPLYPLSSEEITAITDG